MNISSGILKLLLIDNIHAVKDIASICRINKSFLKFRELPWRIIDKPEIRLKRGILKIYSNVVSIEGPFFLTFSREHYESIKKSLENKPNFKTLRIVDLLLFETGSSDIDALTDIFPFVDELEIYDTCYEGEMKKPSEDINFSNIEPLYTREVKKEGVKIGGTLTMSEGFRHLFHDDPPVYSMSLSMLKGSSSIKNIRKMAMKTSLTTLYTTCRSSTSEKMFGICRSSTSEKMFESYLSKVLCLRGIVTMLHDIKVPVDKSIQPNINIECPFLKQVRNFIVEDDRICGPLADIFIGHIKGVLDGCIAIVEILLQYGKKEDIKRLDLLIPIVYAMHLEGLGVKLEKYHLMNYGETFAQFYRVGSNKIVYSEEEQKDWMMRKREEGVVIEEY